MLEKLAALWNTMIVETDLLEAVVVAWLELSWVYEHAIIDIAFAYINFNDTVAVLQTQRKLGYSVDLR